MSSVSDEEKDMQSEGRSPEKIPTLKIKLVEKKTSKKKGQKQDFQIESSEKKEEEDKVD